MKLGLLDAVPQEKYLPGEKTDPEKFRHLFATQTSSEQLPHYTITCGQYPQSVNECDAYLITGSPSSSYENLPWIPPLENFVQQCYERRIPLVGICFGHQIIAQALGGQVTQASQGWCLGLKAMDVVETRPWMQNTFKKTSYGLHFLNRDQVIKMPSGAELLCGTEDCPITMFSIDQHVLCLQGHPEQSRSSMQVILEYLKQEGGISDSIHHAALDSMSAGQPDADVFAQWIWQFLTAAIN